MYELNIDRAIKKMTVNKLRDFVYEKYHQRIEFAQENSYYLMKHQKKQNLQLFAT